MILAIIFSIGVGLDNNADSFNYQTNELQFFILKYHRKLVLAEHLYTDGHPEPVYHQPLTRADVSKLNWFYDL